MSRLIKAKEDLQRMRLALVAEKRKVRELKWQLREKKKFTPSTTHKQNTIAAMGKYIEGPAHDFFAAQVENAGRSATGRRWTDEVKVLALGIHNESSKAYRFLSEFFILPSEKTLELDNLV